MVMSQLGGIDNLLFNTNIFRPPGEVDNKKYVSVVSSDDFHTFQQNGFHEDEDIDFTPQNGYLEPEDMDTQEAQGTVKGK